VTEVVIGARLPEVTTRLDSSALVAYAGATWDWHPLHHDFEYVHRLGVDRPVVDGQMFGALLAEQCMKAFGPGTWVRKLSFRLRAVVHAGDPFTLTGEIADIWVEEGRQVARVEQEVTVGDRIAVGPAVAEVVVRD